MELNKYLLMLCGSILFLSFTSMAQDNSGSITLKAEGIDIKDRKGDLIFLVFKGEDSWLKVENAFKKKVIKNINESTAEYTFGDLPFGEDYAVEILHDENGDGKMNMRWFPYPKPKEGFGVIENKNLFGPPKFEKSRFCLMDTVVVHKIKIFYY